MSIKENAELNKIKNSLINDILEYMEVGEVDYTKADVYECKRILEEHFENVLKIRDGDCAIERVRNTALELNKINQKAGEEPVETDQREDLCGRIVLAGVLFNLAHRRLK